MAIDAIAAANPELTTRAQRVVDQAPQEMRDFGEVMESLQQGGENPAQNLDLKPIDTVIPDDLEGIYAEKLDEVQQPGGPERLLEGAQQSVDRLDRLIAELNQGKTYSPEELIGIQGEVHKITLQLEATTKVMGEVVSGVKQLFQQQI